MNKTNLLKVFSILVVSLLLLTIIALQIFQIISNKKESAYNYIQNSVVLEVINEDESVAKGTAVLLSNTHAITVAHLFDNDYATISFYTYGAKVAVNATIEKINNDLDLCLLTFPELDVKLKSINFAKKQSINFGEDIIKIGNALGYGLSVNKGIISTPYIKLEINETMREMIGISIPILGGDSGGGVFKTNNEFLGLISFKTTPSTPTESLSFIIPSYIIKDFLAL